ncbi:hypothetical protein [Mariniflexile sp. AS56]|uniref:hypothetical protein n=1 Tax=Mariniflexile sp. AS56 TaxID=3063957 RepID=UPI0026F1B9CC|nr:hypothetical protein [Mariniflexile sp. AS56]MDO7174097.1 hypothetical protein [Mariniflexile sp. AS56]
MKKILPIIIVGIITGAIGFFAGKTVGYDEAERMQKYRSVESIKSDLKEREIKIVSTLLNGTARIETRNEGGFFSSKKSKYLTGKITNNALVAKAKDVKVIVTFLSKTKSEIGKAEFTIYEYIEPGKSQSFEKKVNVSQDVTEFSWNIVNAKAE